MKYSYSTRQLIVNLIMGIVWMGLGIRSIVLHGSDGIKPFLFILVGVAFLIIFFYQYFKKYFVVTEEWITISSLLDKKVKISELTKMDFTSGIYIFTSPSKRIKIMQPKIKREQIKQFNEWFDKVKDQVENKQES